ncbi:MAG: M48 family metalloprotease [Planctomycetes bacterium]|nr:M48 family metalloprotease [Planctomycetota bacterium]
MTPPILQIIVAALLLGAYGELAPDASLFHPWLSPVLAIGLAVAPLFIGRLLVDALRRRLANRGGDVRGFVASYVRSGQVLRASSLASYAAALFVAHWPRTVSSVLTSLGANDWPLVPEALAFAPFLTAFVATLEPSFQMQALLRPRAWTFGEFVAFQLRGATFVLLPLAIMIALFDGVRASVTLRHWLAIFGYLEAAVLIVPIAILFVSAPMLLRRVFGARPLPDGPLRTSLEAFARDVGFGFRDFLVLRTSGNVVNALIVGIVPRLRYVMFTDALLVNLSIAEIRAVLAHEIGHAKRFHLAIYVVFALTGIFLLLILVRFVFPLAPALFGEDRPLGWASMALFFAMFWGVGFGFLSRRLERDADIFGARAVGDVPLFVGTLERIARLAGNVRRIASWRYFSIERRVTFLEAAERDPAELRRAHRSVLSCLAVLGVLFVASLFFIAADVRGQHEAGLGRLAYERKDLTSAESHLRRAVERSPRDPIYHHDLAFVLWKAGRHSEATREWEIALALVPPDDVAEAIRSDLEKIAKGADPDAPSSDDAGSH